MAFQDGRHICLSLVCLFFFFFIQFSRYMFPDFLLKTGFQHSHLSECWNPFFKSKNWWAQMDSNILPLIRLCSVAICAQFFLLKNWWAQMDSNHRPHAYQACALTTWAMSPFWWRLAGSNRWPPACKAGALPAELNPHIFFSKVHKMNPKN